MTAKRTNNERVLVGPGESVGGRSVAVEGIGVWVGVAIWVGGIEVGILLLGSSKQARTRNDPVIEIMTENLRGDVLIVEIQSLRHLRCVRVAVDPG